MSMKFNQILQFYCVLQVGPNNVNARVIFKCFHPTSGVYSLKLFLFFNMRACDAVWRKM